MKKFGVIRFLGTNCDRDVFQAIEGVGQKPEWLWFEDQFNPDDYQALFIPGGFSYGDYLRCGALAAKAPVMESVRQAAKKGLPVLGICNGFQILCESGLLPGALLRNKGLRFIDSWVELKGRTELGFWKSVTGPGWSGKLPIAHGEGQYFAPEDTLKQLFDQGRVLSTYVNNPNGSVRDIAGITNEAGNVCALMPHPERAFEKFHGSTDGRRFFEVFQ